MHLHQSVFSAEILNNWKSWYETQKLMFSDTDSFIINIALFQWLKQFRFHAEDIVLPEVLASELPGEPAGTQIIVHESEQYGAFTKADYTQHHHLDVSATQYHEVVAGTACIYRWRNTESSLSGFTNTSPTVTETKLDTESQSDLKTVIQTPSIE